MTPGGTFRLNPPCQHQSGVTSNQTSKESTLHFELNFHKSEPLAESYQNKENLCVSELQKCDPLLSPIIFLFTYEYPYSIN